MNDDCWLGGADNTDLSSETAVTNDASVDRVISATVVVVDLASGGLVGGIVMTGGDAVGLCPMVGDEELAELTLAGTKLPGDTAVVGVASKGCK